MMKNHLAALAALSVSAVVMGCAQPKGPENGLIPEEKTSVFRQGQKEEGFFDLFRKQPDPNETVAVNKYIWNASLEVLDFLPVEQVDPFTGVIVTGYGTPPGGGRAYRATVYVQDVALEARSLRVALATRSGPASKESVRAVEDAILTRARQLRLQDGRL